MGSRLDADQIVRKFAILLLMEAVRDHVGWGPSWTPIYRSNMSKARYACKIAANKLAKYGDPKWPFYAFGSFYPTETFAAGIHTLLEDDAQFQNGFGAWAHVQVTCEYDLRQKKVQTVYMTQ